MSSYLPTSIMGQFNLSCDSSLDHMKSNLLVTPEFKAWAIRSSYKLKKLPFAPEVVIGKDRVHYRILHPHPDTTSQQTYTLTEKTVPLRMFLETLQKGYFGGVAVSDILCLYLQMPKTQPIPSEWVVTSTPIFSQLRSFVYSGNPQQLEQGLGVSWASSFPEAEQVKILGRTTSSTFRKVINGCQKLNTLSLNLLFEEGDGRRVFGQPEKVVNPRLKRLNVVSNMGVERVFKGIELMGLKELHLWMMPGVAMELRPEHLGIQAKQWTFYPNFTVDSSFLEVMGCTSNLTIVNPT